MIWSVEFLSVLLLLSVLAHMKSTEAELPSQITSVILETTGPWFQTQVDKSSFSYLMILQTEWRLSLSERLQWICFKTQRVLDMHVKFCQKPEAKSTCCHN